jgi:hypothetical protein
MHFMYCNIVLPSNSTCCIEMRIAAVRLSIVNTNLWLVALVPFLQILFVFLMVICLCYGA